MLYIELLIKDFPVEMIKFQLRGTPLLGPQDITKVHFIILPTETFNQ